MSASARTPDPRRRRPPGKGKPSPKPQVERRPRPTARAVALEVVRRVTDESAYSNLALGGELRRARLQDPRERGLAAELAYGTIRHLLSVDPALERFTSRPLRDAPPHARAVLRLGAYQLLFTRIPPHAAVSETVGLAWPKERGFVNAVLRKLSADPPPRPEGDGDEALSVRTGLSTWAIEQLRRVLPAEEVPAAAEALATHAPLSVRVNRCITTLEDLEQAFEARKLAFTRGSIHPDCLLVERGDPASLPGHAEGWFAVQDQASAFVVSALEAEPGHRVLDACAGPGGKAAYASCLVQPDGTVVAADAVPHRATLVRNASARLAAPMRVLVQDAMKPAIVGPFDRILVDAPCSGIGSARRRPELLWRTKKDDLARLARLQVQIVTGVADRLAPGGRLVYSVCTFPEAETDAAVRAILKHRPDLRPATIEGPDGPAEKVRLWPHRHGTDAMFVAAFTRS